MNITNTIQEKLKNSRVAVFDLESTLIPASGILGIKKIFCINVKVNNEPIKRFTYLYHPTSDGNLLGALKLLNSCDYIVGHNIIGFDIPVIENLVGKLTVFPIDTLLISKIMYAKDQLYAIDYGIPDFPKKIMGNYSLKAFGYRFGSNKIFFEQFDKLTDDMLTYCDQDVELSYKILEHVLGSDSFPNDQVIELENKVAKIIKDQQLSGFYFDLPKARELSTKMKFEQSSIERRLQKRFRPMFLPEGPVKQTNKIITRRKYIPDEKSEARW